MPNFFQADHLNVTLNITRHLIPNRLVTVFSFLIGSENGDSSSASGDPGKCHGKFYLFL